MQITVPSVLQYLRTRVGEGSLKLSDIFFSIPKTTRTLFDAAVSKREGKRKINWRKLPKNGYSRDELNLYLELSSSSLFCGDLYEHIAAMEVLLHDFVKATLISTLGRGEGEWWRSGVPVPIRKDCHARREEDDDPVNDPFAYTTFINLKSILEKNWSSFAELLPKRWAHNKKDFLKAFDRLNGIRNAVMHPVKKRAWTEDDFEFVRDFHSGLCECRPMKQPQN